MLVCCWPLIPLCLFFGGTGLVCLFTRKNTAEHFRKETYASSVLQLFPVLIDLNETSHVNRSDSCQKGFFGWNSQFLFIWCASAGFRVKSSCCCFWQRGIAAEWGVPQDGLIVLPLLFMQSTLVQQLIRWSIWWWEKTTGTKLQLTRNSTEELMVLGEKQKEDSATGEIGSPRQWTWPQVQGESGQCSQLKGLILGGPVQGQGLDSVVFVGLFQLGIFSDFVWLDVQSIGVWEGEHLSEVGGVDMVGSAFPWSCQALSPCLAAPAVPSGHPLREPGMLCSSPGELHESSLWRVLHFPHCHRLGISRRHHVWCFSGNAS